MKRLNLYFERFVVKTFLIGFLALCLAVPAAAQSSSGQFKEKPGRLVMSAIEDANASKYDTAIATLNQALALPDLSAYEISTIEQMLGAYHYETEDLSGAMRHFSNALSTGGLSDKDKKMLERNVAQLMIASGDYSNGARALETWVAEHGETAKDVSFIWQAFIQAEDYQSARPWAEKWFASIGDPSRKEYDMMQFLYFNLDMEDEQLFILDDIIEKWPDDLTARQNRISHLFNIGEEQKAYESLTDMYTEGFTDSHFELEKLVNYHVYYKNYNDAFNLIMIELASGRLNAEEDVLKLLEYARQNRLD